MGSRKLSDSVADGVSRHLKQNKRPRSSSKVNKRVHGSRKSEEALRASESRYRVLFETIPHGLFQSTPDGKLITANPALVRMLGYASEQELLAVDIRRDLYVNPEDRDRWMRRVEETSKLTTEVVLRRKDGEQLTALSDSHAVRDEHGRVLYYEGTLTDITERKRLEQDLKRYSEDLQRLVLERTKELRTSERKYRSLVENIPDVVWTSDRQANTIFASPNIERLYGYTREEIYEGGYSLLRQRIHPDDVKNVEKAYEALFTRNEMFDIEYRFQRQDGRWVWLHDRATTTYQRDGALYSDGVTWDITQRKRIEDALRESEELYSRLANNMVDMVCEVDMRDSFTYVSPSCKRLLGYDAEDMLGKPIYEYIHAKDKDGFLAQIKEEARSQTTPMPFAFRHKRADGNYLWVESLANPVFDEHGRPTSVIIVIRDITERRNMEEELRVAKERLEYVITSNPAVIFTGKPHGDHANFDTTYMSESVISMLGYEPQRFVADPEFWERHVHPDDKRRVLAELPRLFTDGHLACEYRFLHKDGAYRWVREETRAVCDVTGNPREVIGYWTDATERKSMEEELRAIGERLEYVITSNPAVVFTGKARPDYSDYDATYMSNSVVSLVGFGPRELIDDPNLWASRVHPDDLLRYLTEVPNLWKSGHYTFEYRFLHKDGSYRWIHEEARVMRDATDKITDIIGYWTDVTERKRLEEMRERFIVLVTHELRTPLAPIKAYVELALTGKLGPLSPELESSLRVMQSDADRLMKLTSDLLDIRRLETGNYQLPMQPLDFREIIDESIKETKTSIEQKEQNLHVNALERPLQIKGDPVRLCDVMVNLLDNASKFTPRDGEITIRVDETPDSIEVQISDTGIGIQKDDLERVFVPFAAIKKPEYCRGPGLGLSLTKVLIEAHGGKIWADSRGDGKGATFTFILPKQRETERVS